MEAFLSQLINGLQRGSIYALIALGYTMVYGVLRLINFAHGEVFMIGAFVGYFAALLFGLSLPAALLAAMAVCGLLAVAMEAAVYRPLRYRPRLSMLIAAIGVSLLLSSLVQAIAFQFKDRAGNAVSFAGANYTNFPKDQLIRSASYRLIPGSSPPAEAAELRRAGREVYVTRIQLLDFGVSLVLMSALWLLVRRTTLGMAMRACANNKDALSLMGVNVNRVISMTFLVGGALAGAGGLLSALTYPQIVATMGLMPGLKAFIAAVLGGIGNVPGAMVGGLLLGLAEVGAIAALPGAPVDYTPLADGVAFALLILVLLVRPQGIFGEEASEKV